MSLKVSPIYKPLPEAIDGLLTHTESNGTVWVRRDDVLACIEVRSTPDPVVDEDKLVEDIAADICDTVSALNGLAYTPAQWMGTARKALRHFRYHAATGQTTPDSSLTERLDRIQAALEHYQHVDDGAFSFLKGFAAKTNDIDPNSMARGALADLAVVRQHEASAETVKSGGNPATVDGESMGCVKNDCGGVRSREIPDNKCPDCGATMIEVCSGLEIGARGEAAAMCRHSDYCEKPSKPVSGEVAGSEAARTVLSSENSALGMPDGSNPRTSRAPADDTSELNNLACANDLKTDDCAPTKEQPVGVTAVVAHSIGLLDELREELETQYQQDLLSSWPWANLYTVIHNLSLHGGSSCKD